MRRAVWRQGWWAGARVCPSPNEGPRPVAVPGGIDMVVLHSISVPAGRYGGPEIKQLFTNRLLDPGDDPALQHLRGLQVSAHFVIRRDGRTLQFVSCDRRAWHAGRSHWAGRDNTNDFSIGIELEGLEGERFEEAQYRALVRLLRALRRRYPVRVLLGHEHVAPGRKNDPGPGFDWRGLRFALGWSARIFPATR